MALTPEDVRNKQFTTSRFKEGYDLDEVDDFLDEIEQTFTALTKEVEDLKAIAKGEIPTSIREELSSLGSENARLKSELESALSSLETARMENEQLAASGSDDEVANELRANLAAVQAELAAAREELGNTSGNQDELAGEVARLSATVEELTAANAQLAAENEELKNAAPAPAVMDAADASTASVRILELAQRTADEAVASARIESEQLRAAAEAETQALISNTNAEVERLMNETKSNIEQMTRDFEIQKTGMERRVEELRAYEREYRSRLRSYLEGQLRELEGKNLGGDRQVEN